jgi:hypothetical protein
VNARRGCARGSGLSRFTALQGRGCAGSHLAAAQPSTLTAEAASSRPVPGPSTRSRCSALGQERGGLRVTSGVGGRLIIESVHDRWTVKAVTGEALVAGCGHAVPRRRQARRGEKPLGDSPLLRPAMLGLVATPALEDTTVGGLDWHPLARQPRPRPARPTSRADGGAASDRGSAGGERRPATCTCQPDRRGHGPKLQHAKAIPTDRRSPGERPATTRRPGRSPVVRIVAGLGDGDSSQLLIVPRGH